MSILNLQYSPIVVVGDNEGNIFRTDEDLDVISSLGGQDSIQLLSVTKACLSSHW